MDNARIYIKNLSVQTREEGALYSDIFFQFLISKRKEFVLWQVSQQPNLLILAPPSNNPHSDVIFMSRITRTLTMNPLILSISPDPDQGGHMSSSDWPDVGNPSL